MAGLIHEIVLAVATIGLAESLLLACIAALIYTAYRILRHVFEEIKILKAKLEAQDKVIKTLEKDVDACHNAKRDLQERNNQQQQRITAGLVREDLLSQLVREQRIGND